MFILIESGAALFFIQLVRLVAADLVFRRHVSVDFGSAYTLTPGIHQMVNVSIDKPDSSDLYFADNVSWLGYSTYNHLGAGVNGTLFP